MTAPEGTAKSVLAGLTVVDLTTFLSGPYATQILGDLGAEVIKIEQPGAGDATRILPPHFVHGDSAYFHSVNRNKQSIVLDLKRPAARDLLLRLLADADVLIENFRPGVMDRLGLSEEVVRAANPKLVWCSLTGFGGEGPYSGYPAYDMIVQALSGGMSLTGEKDGRPVRAGIPLGDLSGGMFSVIGILAALNERHASGVGRRVDVSMLDCQISMLTYQAQYAMVSGETPGRQGAEHDSIPTYRAFSCGDGEQIAVCANNQRMWASLCDVLGCPELVGDPRFSDNAERLKNRQALWQILEARFLERSAAELFPLLMQAGVPAAPVNTVPQALADPQVVSRGMVVTAEADDGRTLKMAGNPVRVEGSGEIFRHPPRLGEHTATVLRERLGLSDEEIAALAASGSIALAGERG